VRGRRLLLSLLAGAALGPRPAAAQSFTADADAGLSRAQPPAGRGAEPATYLLAGLRAVARSGAVRLHAGLYGGLPTGAGDGDWAALRLGAGWRTALGPRLGLDAGLEGSASALGGPAAFRAVTLEARPELTYLVGSAELLLRGRAGVGGSRVTVRGAGAGPGNGRPRRLDGGDHLWLAGGGPGLRVDVGGYEVTGRLEAFSGGVGGYRSGTLELDGSEGRIRWGASVGVWGTPSGAEGSASLEVRLSLGGGWSASASGGRSEPDPMLGTPPAAYATGVVSRRLATVVPEAEALYRVVRRGVHPRIEFSVRAPDARAVAVTGDFTDWRPVAMHRSGDRWVLERRVAPGTYHFGFLVDGRWYVPGDAPGRVSDAWGRANATLVVP